MQNVLFLLCSAGLAYSSSLYGLSEMTVLEVSLGEHTEGEEGFHTSTAVLNLSKHYQELQGFNLQLHSTKVV